MRKSIVLLLLCFIAAQAAAHVVPYDLDPAPPGEVFWKYLVIGFEHIIPLGLDHILFILCLFFLNTSVRQIVLQATMFTLAHSITLGLAVYGLIDPPPEIVEPLIAASILILALENIASDKVRPWRMVMVFLFGLVHGMGFAGVLADLGMPRASFATALVAFNVGVELGQLSIIVAMYLAVTRTVSGKSWYRSRVVIPASVLIALVALYWTVDRTFFQSGS